MGESTIDGGIWVSSISSVQKRGVSLSITLAIVGIAKMSIRSISLGRGIKSLGDWVKTSAGAEWDAVVGRVEQLRVSLSLTLANAIGMISISNTVAWDWHVSSVHTRGTLKPYKTMSSISIRVAQELSLSRDGGHEGGCYNQKLHDTALIY